jgi:hypothetical protein
MVAIAFVRTILAPVHLDYLQDVLSGLNVRQHNYLAPDVEVDLDPYYDDRFDPVLVPFAVLVYNDGLDYDMDGNAYFDDYPSDDLATAHRTREGAERSAAWMEHHGIKANRITIVENYWTHKWEMEYHPLEN